HQKMDDTTKELAETLEKRIHIEEEQCDCVDDDEDDVVEDEGEESMECDVNSTTSSTSDTSTTQTTKTTKTIRVRAEVICKKCNRCKLVPLKIPFYGPYTVRGLKKGVRYEYCTCGLSKNQPFCDKAHVGTPFRPIPFTLPHDQSMWLLCGCRYSKNIPYCDAEHTRLPFNPQDPPCACDKAKELTD
ncbi:hypothetical protein SAMD00019534_073200, partial [Acytostelium subglobosum LB1]|uniref:hypothetical protein n=1 Tax=Acytostelium subglobosum LB1 TaxID=1410327 RepID=UPI000644DC5E